MMNHHATAFTCGSLFSGIGGFCFGFKRAGFRTIWASDNDARVAQTYRKNFPEVQFLEEDIHDLDLNELTTVDVLHAGFPCQSFSSAGNRKGFEDPRGKLFDIMMNHINSLSSKPKILVFENSSYLTSGDGGQWFERIRSRIKRAGYWFADSNALRLCTSIHFGLPQQRERLFLMATNRKHFDYNPFNYLPDKPQRSGLLNYIKLEPVQDETYYLKEHNKYNELLSREGESMRENQVIQLRKREVRLKSTDLCPTLTANMGLGGHNVPFVKENQRLRKLTERECLNLQGFPKKFKWPDMPASNKYQQIGNAVSPAVSFWIARQVKKLLEGKF